MHKSQTIQKSQSCATMLTDLDSQLTHGVQTSQRPQISTGAQIHQNAQVTSAIKGFQTPQLPRAIPINRRRRATQVDQPLQGAPLIHPTTTQQSQSNYSQKTPGGLSSKIDKFSRITHLLPSRLRLFPKRIIGMPNPKYSALDGTSRRKVSRLLSSSLRN